MDLENRTKLIEVYSEFGESEFNASNEGKIPPDIFDYIINEIKTYDIESMFYPFSNMF